MANKKSKKSQLQEELPIRVDATKMEQLRAALIVLNRSKLANEEARLAYKKLEQDVAETHPRSIAICFVCEHIVTNTVGCACPPRTTQG